MEANNLSYKFDDILNVSVNRTMKKQYFDTRSYTATTTSTPGQAVSTWNSGVEMIDLKNSYLKFNVSSTAVAATWGSGSAMNLIKEVKILSSSGVELSRTQDANYFHKFQMRAKRSTDWLLSVGSNMGAGTVLVGQLATGAMTGIAVPTTGVDIVIPLCELDPFFDLYDGKLLPANIASGLRVEITWESHAIALFNVATGSTGYAITAIEFRTESVTLADSAMAVLNKEASTNGLEVTYDRVYTTSKSTAVTEENIEVRKAVSLAKSAFCVTILDTNRVLILDSFLANIYDYTSADFRLGNQYYPFQPIENAAEGYANYLRCYNKHKTAYDTSITKTHFTLAAAGNAMLCANFETDDSLNLTGLPINSSRILEVRSTRTAAPASKAFVFLTYTALARASLSNCSVKI